MYNAHELSTGIGRWLGKRVHSLSTVHIFRLSDNINDTVCIYSYNSIIPPCQTYGCTSTQCTHASYASELYMHITAFNHHAVHALVHLHNNNNNMLHIWAITCFIEGGLPRDFPSLYLSFRFADSLYTFPLNSLYETHTIMCNNVRYDSHYYQPYIHFFCVYLGPLPLGMPW